jgi:conjugal transfer pilus assembly protein TraV
MNSRVIALGTTLFLLAGCANFSGLDSSSKFSCVAAPGVNCQSMTGVSQNAEAGNLPFQRGETQDATQDDDRDAQLDYAPDRLKKKKMSPADMRAIYSGEPLRQAPLVLRIWVAPFEDEDSDLHDQSIFYTQVHNGRWMIDSTRALIRAQYRPFYRLDSSSGGNDAPAQNPEPGQTLFQRDSATVNNGSADKTIRKMD